MTRRLYLLVRLVRFVTVVTLVVAVALVLTGHQQMLGTCLLMIGAIGSATYLISLYDRANP